MLEHSVEAYLHRRDSNALLSFLKWCCNSGQLQQYKNVLPILIHELTQRGVQIPPEFLSLWNKVVDVE